MLKRVLTTVLVAGVSLLVGCQKGGGGGSCLIAAHGIRGIRNGDTGNATLYPWATKINITATSFLAQSSGTLISYGGTQVILSAAHCYVDPTLGTVQSASMTWAGSSTPIKGTAYVTHPSYVSTDFDSPDLSITFLASNSPVTPATRGSTPLAIGTSAVDMGYGYNCVGPDGNGTLGNFLQGIVTIIDPADPNFGCGTTTNICAHGSTTKDQETCEGDSGGPLVGATDNAIYGALSGGAYKSTDQTCRGSLNSIYTPVHTGGPYDAWITTTISNGPNCGAACKPLS